MTSYQMKNKLVLVLLFITLHPMNLYAFEISMPIDCKIGENCFIQNYVDMSEGKKRSDYKCGILSYDKHKGTDFAISTKDEFNVLAAARGKVIGTRNNMQDINYKLREENKVKNIECGNGLLLKHEDGWETQYCHMKQGSISVKTGQVVNKGDVIGKVGLSGFTEFKHLHLSVRKDGKSIDPFSSEILESGCNDNNVNYKNIWDSNTAKSLQYTKTSIVDFGINDTLPLSELNARNGDYNNIRFNNKTKVMLFWLDTILPKYGDIIKVKVTYPSGRIRDLNVKNDKNYVRRFQYFGIKKTTPKWSQGTYKINYLIKRNDKIIAERKMDIEIL